MIIAKKSHYDAIIFDQIYYFTNKIFNFQNKNFTPTFVNFQYYYYFIIHSFCFLLFQLNI